MICSGWSMTPQPQEGGIEQTGLAMIPRARKPRSRKEVQNGRMMMSSRMLCVLLDDRAMP